MYIHIHVGAKKKSVEFFAYYAAKFVFSILTEKKTHLLDLTLCKQPFIVCDLAENIIAGVYVVNRCTFYLLYFIFCAHFFGRLFLACR